MRCYKRFHEINFLIADLIFHRGVKNQKHLFAPDFFCLKKMKLESQKQIEIRENIICLEAALIRIKKAKLEADEEYERHKAQLEESIKNCYHNIAIMKLKAILKQKGWEWNPALADHLDEKEIEKEFQRWKNLAPEEKIKKNKERIDMLQKDVPSQKEDEDWEPMTDIEVDRWIEEENEKEMERLEKLEAQEKMNEKLMLMEALREAEKNN